MVKNYLGQAGGLGFSWIIRWTCIFYSMYGVGAYDYNIVLQNKTYITVYFCQKNVFARSNKQARSLSRLNPLLHLYI